MTLIIFILLYFTGISLCSSQEPVPHIFIHLNENEDVVPSFQLGHYAYDEAFNVSIINDTSKIVWSDSGYSTRWLDKHIEQVSPNRPKILLYIHGYQADSKMYQKFANKEYHKHIYADSTSPYGLIINLVWGTHPLYNKAIESISDISEALNPVIHQIVDSNLDNTNGSLSIVAHSMGNRLLLGAIDYLVAKDSSHQLFEHIVMACPDVESSLINSSTLMAQGKKIANDITIYMHNNDRVLGVARSLTGDDRLGLNGPKSFKALSPNTVVVDASLIADSEDFGSRLSNHRYFFTSPQGRDDFKFALGIPSGGLLTERKVLNRPNYLMLSPLTEK